MTWPATRRSDGERIRARHALSTLRTILDSATLAIEDARVPPGADLGQTLTQAAVTMAVTLGKLDAYMRAEDDAQGER